MPTDIKAAILEKDLTALASLSAEELIEFKDADESLNAFMFACVKHADVNVVRIILEKTLNYFTTRPLQYEEINITDIAKLSLEDDGDDIEDDSVSPSSNQILNHVFEFYYGTVLVSDVNLYAPALAFIHQQDDTVALFRDILHFEPLHDEFLRKKNNEKLTKSDIKRAFSSVTKKHGDCNLNAFFTSKKPTSYRPPRQFHGGRERQLLKQLSTVIYFYIKANNSQNKLVETELMHLKIGDVSHLIISCNAKDKLAGVFPSDITMGDLQDRLKNNIEVRGDTEGRERVTRYQKILGKIFDNEEIGHSLEEGENSADIQCYQQVVKLLQEKNTTVHIFETYTDEVRVDQDPIIAEIFSANESRVIILDNGNPIPSHQYFHAEEYLVKILLAIKEHAKGVNDDATIYSCIAGKKRPCSTCYATMTHFWVNNHGSRPGFAWKTAVDSQVISSAQLTVLSMLRQQCYVTQSKNNKFLSGYDSGSDDDEIENESRVYRLG